MSLFSRMMAKDAEFVGAAADLLENENLSLAQKIVKSIPMAIRATPADAVALAIAYARCLILKQDEMVEYSLFWFMESIPRLNASLKVAVTQEVSRRLDAEMDEIRAGLRTMDPNIVMGPWRK